jgi:hypothetical protein
MCIQNAVIKREASMLVSPWLWARSEYQWLRHLEYSAKDMIHKSEVMQLAQEELK